MPRPKTYVGVAKKVMHLTANQVCAGAHPATNSTGGPGCGLTVLEICGRRYREFGKTTERGVALTKSPLEKRQVLQLIFNKNFVIIYM